MSSGLSRCEFIGMHDDGIRRGSPHSTVHVRGHSILQMMGRAGQAPEPALAAGSYPIQVIYESDHRFPRG